MKKFVVYLSTALGLLFFSFPALAMEDLPDDIKKVIIRQLRPEDLLSARGVCKNWGDLVYRLTTHLDLTQNAQIPDVALSHFANLTALNLSVNFKITDKAVSNLTNLTALDLRHNTAITDLSLLKKFTKQ